MKFTIYKRLTFGYAVIMILLIFMGTYGITRLNQLNNISKSILLLDTSTVRLTEELLEKLLSQISFAKKYTITKDPDFHEQFKQIGQYILKNMEELESILNAPFKKKKLITARALYNKYLEVLEKEAFSNSVKNPEEVNRQEQDELADRIQEELKMIIIMARIDKDSKMALSSQIVSSFLKVSKITSLLAVLMGLFISFYNTNSINKPIMLLQDKTKDIASGKFEKISNIVSPPEINELADHFNMMVQRLKELDEMKQDFISHISHELRTPLTVIKETSSMLMEGVYADNPKKQQDLLQIMYEDCERLINSVNRILDLSRIEANMMEYQFQESNIFIIIHKIVLKMMPFAQRKNIALEFNYPSELPLVNIDEEQIGNVVENLIENALKYTQEGGRVFVDVSWLDDEKRAVEVSVSDTGHGIVEEDIEKIFEKFRRIDKGKDTIRGTGLGLSICKHIISNHGGKIWAKSELGKGSSFFFTLPVA